MLPTLIENKVIEILTTATITNVDTNVVVGVDKWLLPFEQYTDFPRLIVACESIDPDSVEIQAVTKDYVVNIFVLCYNIDKDDVLETRDAVAERVEQALRSNQRLGNLADNNKEKVYSSSIGPIQFVKFGSEGAYYAIAWIEYLVHVERSI
jgi:hypothetical protein